MLVGVGKMDQDQWTVYFLKLCQTGPAKKEKLLLDGIIGVSLGTTSKIK